MPEEKKMKILHPPSPDPQRGWSKKGLETTSKLRKENAERAPKGLGELLDEKVPIFYLLNPASKDESNMKLGTL
jgi:hypothetical protein